MKSNASYISFASRSLDHAHKADLTKMTCRYWGELLLAALLKGGF